MIFTLVSEITLEICDIRETETTFEIASLRKKTNITDSQITVFTRVKVRGAHLILGSPRVALIPGRRSLNISKTTSKCFQLVSLINQ